MFDSPIPVVGLLIAGCVAATYWLTGVVRSYALRSTMLDVPNARSSHSVPTPRGGGLAIALVAMAGWSAACLAGLISPRLFAALAGGGAIVALAGWMDDRHHVAPPIRALAHVLAAVWAVAWLGGLPDVRLGGAVIPLGYAGGVIAVLGVVWMVNLYNFMDGIDGIAAGEAVSAGAIIAALALMVGDTQTFAATAVIVACCGAFLTWNWSPARIFMGDVGSGLLGFCFGVLALASERIAGVPLVAWLIVFGVFIVDATVTLVRRAARGERWHEAHRSHAYQRAVQSGMTHAHVSGTVIVMTALLGGFAAIGVVFPNWMMASTLVAVTTLALAYGYVESRCPM